jgi:iron complex outermembrane receptor protein
VKRQQLLQNLLLTGSAIVLATTPALSEEVKVNTQSKLKLTDNRNNSHKTITKIPQLNELDLPLRSAQRLVQTPTPGTTPSPTVVEVSGVRLRPTEKGVEVILETTSPKKLQVTNKSEGNNFIADIANAQLRLPGGDTFRSENPIAGIPLVTVTNQNANTIRVTVLGKKSQPKVELFESNKALIFSFVPVVSPAPESQPPQTQQQPEISQPETETKPAQPSADEQETIELLVTGEQEGYLVPEATAGTRTNTLLRDIPQSIQIIPRELIEDRQVTRLQEALRSISGIVPTGQTRGTFETYNIRGFDAQIFQDGLPNDYDSRIPTETANLERVEVVKGPASVLYGRSSPGGIINLVTKKPLPNPFYGFDLTIGNYDFYRGTVDLSGPLNDDKTVLYRLNAAYQNSESFVDFFETERFFVSPVVSWAITPNTNLTFQVEHNRADFPVDRGLPAEGTVLDNPVGEIPISRNIAEPDQSFSNRRLTRVGYTLEHKFSENWSLRNAFKFTNYSFEQDSFFQQDFEENRLLSRGFITGESEENAYNLTTEVIGNFRTGSIKHKLLFGVDLYRQDELEDTFVGFNIIEPLDLFDPVYGADTRGEELFRGDSATLTDFIGVFIQDQIELTNNLKLVLGGRWDYLEQTNEDFLSDTEEFQSDTAFSPRVGIVYQPIEPISVYATYTRSFNPVVGQGFGNALFEPERGTLYEVGVKADLRDNLAATLSLFQITRTNVLTTDPDNPEFSIQTGEQRSRGVELTLTGEILPGWKVFAGYSYIDARITEDEDNPEGNLINNVPENSLSLWTTYEIQSGIAKGLGFGLGLFYVGDREGDLANTFTLPSYVRTDASIFYKRNNFQATIGFRNIFDVEYYEAAESDLRVFPGEPFTVLGTLSLTF